MFLVVVNFSGKYSKIRELKSKWIWATYTLKQEY